MSTRKCSKCGWIYPKTWPGRTCKFCHTKFVDGFCGRCGEWFDELNSKGWCKKCNAKNDYDWHHARKDAADERYNNWLEQIKRIQTPYKTLTEQEWLEACIHFGGCAYCGTAQIDARAMFIKFKNGGRYCSWNIVPMCEKCAKIHDAIENPFKSMDESVYRNPTNIAEKYGHDLENLQGTIDYLQTKMEV